MENKPTFIQKEGLELVRFKKGQRKDDVLQKKLRQFKKDEGVIFVGVAQERVRVPRSTYYPPAIAPGRNEPKDKLGVCERGCLVPCKNKL